MIASTDFASLKIYLDEVYNESADNAIAEVVGMEVFKIMDKQRETHIERILHGMENIQRVAEGQDFPAVSSVQGDSFTSTQLQYGTRIPVTKRMRLFELYDEINAMVRSNSDAAFHLIDQSYADVLTNGFSASNYTDVYGSSVAATGPDGLALFTASHSNPLNSNTFSNLMTYPAGTSNPALSRESLVRNIQLGLTYTDPVALNRPIRYDTLCVAPGNFDLAVRLTQTDKIPESTENDTNKFLKGRLNIKVWEKLQTRTGGTDTSAYWFLYDSKKVGESLKSIFAQRPLLHAPEEINANKNWEWTLDYFYSIHRGWPAYIRGSTGAN